MATPRTDSSIKFKVLKNSKVAMIPPLGNHVSKLITIHTNLLLITETYNSFSLGNLLSTHLTSVQSFGSLEQPTLDWQTCCIGFTKATKVCILVL